MFKAKSSSRRDTLSQGCTAPHSSALVILQVADYGDWIEEAVRIPTFQEGVPKVGWVKFGFVGCFEFFYSGGFSSAKPNSNWLGASPANSEVSCGASSQTIVRNNAALSAHKLICHVRRRLLKNICPKPNWFFSKDWAGSIQGRTCRNRRLDTRLVSGINPNNVSCAPAA